jgi:hypothetical protein
VIPPAQRAPPGEPSTRKSNALGHGANGYGFHFMAAHFSLEPESRTRRDSTGCGRAQSCRHREPFAPLYLCRRRFGMSTVGWEPKHRRRLATINLRDTRFDGTFRPRKCLACHRLVPESPYWSPRLLHSLWKPKEIYITENGSAASHLRG